MCLANKRACELHEKLPGGADRMVHAGQGDLQSLLFFGLDFISVQGSGFGAGLQVP